MYRFFAIGTLLLLVSYGVFKAVPIISGPSIALASPTASESFESGIVTISGVATHTVNLYLNGAILPIDNEGKFSTSLTLPRGGAILSLTATDRFGKTQSLRRSVFVP